MIVLNIVLEKSIKATSRILQINKNDIYVVWLGFKVEILRILTKS